MAPPVAEDPMSRISVYDPDGKQGTIPADNLAKALQGGYTLAQKALEVYDPTTKRTGMIPAANALKALDAGYLPAGSKAHQLAEMDVPESIARGVGEGLMGLGTKAEAGIRSAIGPNTYEQELAIAHQRNALAAEAHPVGYYGGELAAGLGTAALPIPGTALKAGAGAADVAKAGAILGGITGAIKSDAPLTGEGLLQRGEEAGLGALTGGAIGGGLNLAGQAASGVAGAAGKAIGKFFDPVLNKLRAMGISARDAVKIGDDKLAKHLATAEEAGVFTPIKDAATGATQAVSRETIHKRLETDLRDEAVDTLHTLFRQHAKEAGALDIERFVGTDLSSREAITQAGAAAAQRIEASLKKGVPANWEDQALAKIGDAAQRTFNDSEVVSAAQVLQKRLAETGGDLGKAWNLKRAIGDEVNWGKSKKDMPFKDEVFSAVNEALNGQLDRPTHAVEKRLGLTSMQEANDKYAAYAIFSKILGKAEEAAKFGNAPPLNKTDYAVGTALGGLGTTLGGPMVGIPAFGAGAAGSAFMRSPTGNLARASVGEAAAKVARTTSSISQWVTANKAALAQQFPQIAAVLSQPMSETTVRAILPFITPFLTPSKYQSEIDGKVTAPADRIAAAKDITDAKLPATDMAQHLSALNKDGTVPQMKRAATPQRGY